MGTLDTTFRKYWSGGTQGILSTNPRSLVCSSIADSLSHTSYVETNQTANAHRMNVDNHQSFSYFKNSEHQCKKV